MCYSAHAVPVIRKLNRQLGVHLDSSKAERPFLRRLEDPSIDISRGFKANFEQDTSEPDRRINTAIQAPPRALREQIREGPVFAKARLVTAERALATKETKKAREDVRIATSKIGSFTEKLSDRRRAEPKRRDNRVFPNVYAGVIITSVMKHEGSERAEKYRSKPANCARRLTSARTA